MKTIIVLFCLALTSCAHTMRVAAWDHDTKTVCGSAAADEKYFDRKAGEVCKNPKAVKGYEQDSIKQRLSGQKHVTEFCVVYQCES